MRYLLSLVIFLFSTAGVASSAHSAEPLKIGLSMALTGKYAALGDLSLKAYKLWEADVNKRGGILGRSVTLVVYDDKSDPATASEIYKKLILVDKVDLVFGPYASDITEAVAPVTEQYGYPLLASGAAADVLWQKGYKYLFGVFITASKYTVGFLEVLVNNGFDKVAVITADDLFSRSIAKGTKAWATRFDLDVVFFEEFRKDAKSLDEIVKRAEQSGAQALIVCGHMDESINARIALKNTGWSPRAYYATVGPAVQKFHDVLKDDADYTFSSSQWEPSSPFPGAKEFAAAFSKAYRKMPSYHAANAYAAGQILESAIRKAKSTDRAKVRDVLASLDTITIIGRYGVDATGKQVRHFATTVQWQKGKKESVAPPEIVTAMPLWR